MTPEMDADLNHFFPAFVAALIEFRFKKTLRIYYGEWLERFPEDSEGTSSPGKQSAFQRNRQKV